MKAPDGQMRGPGTRPASMPRFSPNTGPPRSRMLVKPRISMSLAALTAATLTKPMSPVSTATCGTVANMMCVWASIRPGISVRPPPAIRVTVAPAGAAIGAVEIALMTLPTTSTFDGADSRSEVPSKMRTFSKITPVGGFAGVGAVWAAVLVATTSALSTAIDRILWTRCWCSFHPGSWEK